MTVETRSRPARVADAATAVVLDLPCAGQAELLGGKGASLDSLLRNGIPVPMTAVVTTAAYRLVAGGPPLRALLEELGHGRLPGPSETAAAVADVDSAFLDVVLPAGLEAEIVERTRPLWSAGPVAVRSSATTEDLHGASFAGQYRSFLGVSGPQQLMKAVRLTWASLWHPAPRSYRRFRGIAEDDVAMAVIVMRMVDAELSGVAFTVDPAGDADALRVEVVHGLAEKLVSGKVTPRAFVVPRGTPRSWAADAPPALESVADLSLQIERGCGGEPQDVEWAHDGERTWIVQARPITVLGAAPDDDGFDSALDAEAVSTTAGIAEMLPGALAPLVWETDAVLVEEAFRSLFASLGALPHDLGREGFLRRVRGRAVLDLAVLKGVASGLPGGSPEEVERQYFGVEGSTETRAVRRSSPVRRALHDLRVGRVRRRAVAEGDVVRLAIEQLTAQPVDLCGMTDQQLLAYRVRLLDLAGRAMAAEVAVAASAVSTYTQLESLLVKHFGQEQGPVWAQEVTARAGAEALRGRRDLLPPVPDQMRDVVAATADWEQARAAMAARPGGHDFVAELHAAWQRTGSSAVFAGPTWSETPGRAWMWLRASVARTPEAGDGSDAVARCSRALQSLDGWRLRRVLTGQVVDVRVSMVRRTIAQTIDLLGRRELVKAAVLALGGEVRRTHLAVGERLVVIGALEVAEDVDHLSPTELGPALAGVGPSLAVVAGRRRWLERMARTAALPSVFTGPPPPPRAAVHAGTRFTGWGASPGIWTGRVVVLDSPECEGLQRGDVLVARSTDASWAPLFLLAGAVVVEEGGPLSHASIVARELRLPAVLNLPGVVDALRDATGRAVTVDGTTGSVVLADPGEVATS